MRKTSRKAAGLGLGLAIVLINRRAATGTVSAHSDGPGKGSTLRRSAAHHRSAARQSLPPAPEGTTGMPRVPAFECPPALSGLRILVVDDEGDTRELLRYILEQCGSIVTLAGSAGEEALKELQAGGHELLISDIGMPDTDGYAFIRGVRALVAERAGLIPAIALTAYARSEDRAQALRAGFDMHLTKPIEPSELLVVVATLVEGVRRRRG